jgi:hypothetical protein
MEWWICRLILKPPILQFQTLPNSKALVFM